MKHIFLLVTVISMVLVAGCASMNKDQCLMADWQALGYQQGSEGQSATLYNRYQQDCAKHQVKGDFAAFKAGYDQGLQSYCSFERGLSVGKRGEDYSANCTRSKFPEFANGYATGVKQFCRFDTGFSEGSAGKQPNNNCPLSQYKDYARGHREGTHKYSLGQTLNTLQEQLESIDEEIKHAQQKIDAAEKIIISDTSTSVTRKQALEDIKPFKQKQQELDADFHSVEKELKKVEREYQQFR